MFKFVRSVEEKVLLPISIIMFSISGLLMFFESIQRTVLGRSTDWVSEVSIYSMIWAIMLLLASAGKNNEHIRVEIVISKLPILFKRYLFIVVSLLSFIFCIIFIYSSYLVIEHARVTKQLTQSTLQFPIWIVSLILIISGVLLAIYYLESIVYGFKNRSRD